MADRIIVINPLSLVKSFIIPHTTTIEIKCGMYDTDCTVLLNGMHETSFNKSAKIIAAGKFTSKSVILIVRVFRISLQK